MFSPFFCGSFHHEEEEDMEPWSPTSTPRRSKKSGICRSKDSKNPYSNRGLDKFSALLADLEDKKQKIYTQMGSDEISFVRFVYNNSNDCKPIVVRLRDKKQDKTNVDDVKDKPLTDNSEDPIESSTDVNEVVLTSRAESDQKSKWKSFFTWNFVKLDNWRRPSCYLPVMIILILVFLAVYGRSFAILCTSIGWYLVPTIKGGSSYSKKSKKKKKEILRRLSENKIVSDGLSSPRSVITGPTVKSLQQPGHRRSF